MLKIGITGGIGTGKTTVSKIFSILGVRIYNADERAKALYEENQAVKAKVIKLFGEDIYHRSRLNTLKLASIIFNDKEALAKLNGIIHPVVREDFNRWTEIHKQEPYVLKEAALLFESGSYKELDFIITASAPLELRINRIIKRDETTREAVISRINNQLPQEEKEKNSNFIIINDEKKLLIEQVVKLHQILMAKSEHFHH